MSTKNQIELEDFSRLDLFAASLDHLLTLIIGIVPIFYSFDHPDPLITSLWFCKFRGYIFQISLMLSRWFVAFASVDRYLLSSDRIRLRNLSTKKNTYRIIVIIIIFWSIICSHRLIFFEIRDDICAIVNNRIASIYHSSYVIIGGAFLPSGIMIICASLIYRNLLQRRIRLTIVGEHEQQRRNSLDHQVHHLLLIQVFFFVIFIIPQIGNLLFNTISLSIVNRSDDHYTLERFLNFLAELMLYLFPVTSFYLYTLTSRTFRAEFIKCVRLAVRSPQRIAPTTDATNLTHRF